MFIGHYGPAVWDTQRGHAQPIVTLWQGFLAVQAMDIVHAGFLMAGHEGPVFDGPDSPPLLYIPWSHSLLSAVVIAVAAGFLFGVLKRSAGWRGALVVAALAFSHWPLDWLVHRPDLPLTPRSTELFGLGLWDYPWASYALEVGLLGTAIAWWLSVTRGPIWTSLASWLLVALMAALQFSAITAITLDAQAGVLDTSLQPSGVVTGLLFLAVFGTLALAIGVIERFRSPRLDT